MHYRDGGNVAECTVQLCGNEGVSEACDWCGLCPLLISTREITESSQRVEADDLFESFPQFLTPECINQRIDD